MSETNKKTTPTKDPKARINELLETGKQKGVLSYKEIMDALQELELDQEDKLSDLQRELKRTDLSEGERAALLQQITNLIRAKK